jgi:hypothetical protein
MIEFSKPIAMNDKAKIKLNIILIEFFFIMQGNVAEKLENMLQAWNETDQF